MTLRTDAKLMLVELADQCRVVDGIACGVGVETRAQVQAHNCCTATPSLQALQLHKQHLSLRAL